MNSIILEDLKNVYNRIECWETLRGKTVLVTGAYGMLASYIVYMLIFLNEYKDANIKILALGRSVEKAKIRFGIYYNKSYFHFIENDLSNLDNFPYEPEYIFHAASNASSQYYGSDPVGTALPNFLGTYNLLKLAVKSNTKSMLFVSSGEVYGVTNSEFIKENDIGLSNPLDIRYCYGESKRMGECLCKCFCVQYNVPVKIVRLGHTYGPTMDIKSDKRVFSEFVNNVVKKENIVIKSDGLSMRAFCYVADALAGFFSILFCGNNGEAYNVSNKLGLISIYDLAQLLISIVPEYKLKVEFSNRGQDDNYIESTQKIHGVPDTSKVEKLGWKIHYTVKEGFTRTIKSFKM